MIEIRYPRGFWPDIHRFDSAIRKGATPYEGGVFSEWERIVGVTPTGPERLQRAYWYGAQSDRWPSVKGGQLVVDTQVVLESVSNLVWRREAFEYGYIHIGHFVFNQRFATAKPGTYREEPALHAFDDAELVWSAPFARVSRDDQATFCEQMKIGAREVSE